MILRTYGCESCNHMMTVELRSDQWDAEPPECPRCASATYQEFAPPAIGGSVRGRATKLAEDIAANDYGVADFKAEGRPEGRAQVRYQGGSQEPASSWGIHSEALATAVSLGRDTRLKYGSGLDVLQTSLKNGTQPDLIEASKRRSIRVW